MTETTTVWERVKEFLISLVRPKTEEEQRQTHLSNTEFVLQLAIYAVLVVAYFLIVISSLSGWLADLFKNHEAVYAVVALGLIVFQGLFLEIVSVIVHRILRSRLRRD